VKYVLTLLLLISQFSFANTRFAIVIASYNNEAFCKKNIQSALIQNYDNYHIVYINDVSTDKTLEVLKQELKTSPKKDLVTIIDNDTRRGACYNYYWAIHNHTRDDEVIVILDGDDRLASTTVLEQLDKTYSKSDVWLTYGQYRERVGGRLGFNVDMPQDVVSNNSFRQFIHLPSHLKTYYSWLFKKLHLEDLMINNEYLPMSWDIASMIPMIEMARDHFKFLPDVLCIYNNVNPISDHMVDKALQRKLDLHIRSLSVYEPLEKRS